MDLKGFGAKTNLLAVNRQSQSNFDFKVLKVHRASTDVTWEHVASIF
jgi:hypothetical protein